VSTAHAREHGLDGVICGHIHRSTLLHEFDGSFYANTGDWVDRVPALVDTWPGECPLLRLARGTVSVAALLPLLADAA